MALPLSGALSFDEIGVELQRVSGSILNITTAETGGYVALNPYSTYRPNGVTPSTVSEWYGYNHTQVVLIPVFQITKSAPSNVNVNTNFNFTITVTNVGNDDTEVPPVVVTDVLPANMQFVTFNAPGWSINSFGSTIQATRNDTLAPNNSFPQIVLTVKIINCASGAYYNQASVYGGGTAGTQYSNTTTTNASVFSSTISLTRSIQKNDCGAFCVGTFVNVTSPSFTRTSCISQADADALATSDANNWLDANGQAIANTNGSCNCNPPAYTLTKTLDTSPPIYLNGAMQWFIRLTIQNNNTSGTVTISDNVSSHLNIVSHIKPSGWSVFQSGNTISFYTSNVLTVGSTYDFYIIGNANTVGTFTNSVSVSGGGGNTVTANASVQILTPPQPSFTNFIEGNNANPIFKASSNTTAVHLVDDNTIRHSISVTINNASVATNSVRVGKAYGSSIYPIGGGSNNAGWTYNGTEFTNNTTLSPGTYNIGYVDYKIVNFGFLGVESASHQFILYYNNNQITNSFSQYNVAGRAKLNLRLFCGFVGSSNSWLANYIFALDLNGAPTSFIGFTISDYSKDWFISSIYPMIGSGVAMSGYEVFPSGFTLANSNGTISYSLFGQCNITNSNAIAYQWGNPYYYNSNVYIVVDFDANNGSFITC
jgi:uncharacterized repeat protein (TIGR01451 family)